MFIISFMIGLLIVISSIIVLRHEMNRAYNKRAQIIEQSQIYKQANLIEILEDLQLSVQDMNNAFYGIVNEMEGNLSLNQKEISDLREMFVKFKDEQIENVNAKQCAQQALVQNLSQMAYISESSEANMLNKMSSAEKESDESDEDVFQNVDVITKITTMRSQGYSLTEIAKKLEMGMGEIKLLLHMKDKK